MSDILEQVGRYASVAWLVGVVALGSAVGIVDLAVRRVRRWARSRRVLAAANSDDAARWTERKP